MFIYIKRNLLITLLTIFISIPLSDFAAEIQFLPVSAYDASEATYLSTSPTITSNDSAPTALSFNTDGTKMYIVGKTNDSVHQYTLSTPWNPSTFSHISSFSVAAQAVSSEGMSFSADGSLMYIIDSFTKRVFQYSLSTAWDVSTASYTTKNFLVSAQDGFPTGVIFKPDGTNMFVVGYGGDKVYRYSLGTAWDVSTASFVSNFSIAGQELTAHDLAMSPDGLRLFVIGFDGDDVNEYHLSTPWDITTAVFIDATSIGAQENNPEAIVFGNNGLNMYVMGNIGDDINMYSLGENDGFTEVFANNGAVTGQISFRLSGDVFQDTDADNILDVGSEVFLTNVPTGLTPSIVLTQSDTIGTLTFSGNATNHQNIDDVTSILFQFDDTAFVTGPASSITNATGPTDSGAGVNFLDNTVPNTPLPPTISLTTDTGSSNTDGITASTTPLFEGTASSTSIIYLYNGYTLLGTTTSNGSGLYSLYPNNPIAPDGTYNITVVQEVGSIKSATSTALTIIIDTIAPTTTIPDLVTSSDLGLSETDDITSDNTPTIAISCEIGTSISLYNLSPETLLSSSTCSSSSTEITLPLSADGSYDLAYILTDVAGNVSATSTPLTIVIDTSSTISITSPTSTYITNDNTVLINGTTEANASVILYDTDGTTVIGTTTADGLGNWSTTTNTLSEGVHTLYAKAIDTAGNTSSLSTGLNVVIDTAPPTINTISINGNTLTITLSENVATSSTPLSAFEVTVGGSPITPSTIEISGNIITLTISPAVTSTQNVSLTYTDPISNNIVDYADNALVNITISVINNTAVNTVSTTQSNTVGPIFGSSAGYQTITSASLNTKLLGSFNKDSTCVPYLVESIKKGFSNNIQEVTKLQQFLNTYEKETLTVNGVYDDFTYQAVLRFQTKYAKHILYPWGLSKPTGYVYQTTKAKINAIVCAKTYGCPYFTSYHKLGSTDTDMMRVKSFLNLLNPLANLDSTVSVYDLKTRNQIIDFQTRYKDTVLKPWGLSKATAYWYKTTRASAHEIMGCFEEVVLE